MNRDQPQSTTPSASALAELLAAIGTEPCSIPACGRTAVGVVRQQDGSLFPVCESHAEKATALGFLFVVPGDDLSAVEEHELTRAGVGVGDVAPPIRLPMLDPAKESGVGDVVDVSAATQGKPVALVFGSYSVPKFRKNLTDVEAVHRRSAGSASFFLVYGKETELAKLGRKSALVEEEPVTIAERAMLAQRLVDEYGLSMPVLIDGLEYEVTRTFGAFPMRLYLIGRSGQVVYRGGLGPYMFQPAELESAIRDEHA